jgi:hypothetical protein
LAKKFKIDVNSPLNGVWLPGCKGANLPGVTHCGRHNEAYERFVYDALSRETTRDGAISALAEVRRQLLSGELLLNARNLP